MIFGDEKREVMRDRGKRGKRKIKRKREGKERGIMGVVFGDLNAVTMNKTERSE